MPRSRNIYSPDSLERIIAERAPGPREASAAIVRMCERYVELVEIGLRGLEHLRTEDWSALMDTWMHLPDGATLAQTRLWFGGLSQLSDVELLALLDVLEQCYARGEEPSER